MALMTIEVEVPKLVKNTCVSMYLWIHLILTI
jgi:hypothetical protein